MRTLALLLSLLLLAIALPSPADAGVLARPGGAVVFAFDDGCASALALVAPRLEAQGWRGTFYVVSGTDAICRTPMTSAQVATLAARGHDVESHTVTHPDLATLSASQLQAQLASSKAQLEAVTGRAVDHLAYPYGSASGAVEQAAAALYRSGRLYYTGYSAMPADTTNRYELPAIGVLSTSSAATVNGWIDDAKARGVTLILVFHDVTTSPADPYDSRPTQLDNAIARVKADGLNVLTIAQAISGAPPSPPPGGNATFAATFTPTGGNEWWIQVRVASSQPIASVGVSINGGASNALKLQGWGDWAASYHAASGSIVRFSARSSSGAAATSGCYLWTARTPTSCAGGGSTAPPPAPNSSFAATFTNARGNAWWVETNVAVSGGTLAGVDARVNGGAWQALAATSWGSWAKSLSAPPGSHVEFRARSTAGATATSASYLWPPS